MTRAPRRCAVRASVTNMPIAPSSTATTASAGRVILFEWETINNESGCQTPSSHGDLLAGEVVFVSGRLVLDSG